MLSVIGSSIPHIRISPASPVKVYPEPYSPFLSADSDQDDSPADSGYRPRLLSPQCYFPAISPRHSSPLRPADCPPPRGLHGDQFDQLLKVSRDKRAALGSRKVLDLRKELAIKNQRNKQLERRTLFLSRIQEPPPAEEHDGLIGRDFARCRTWFEQADCRQPINKLKTDLKLGSRRLPSLEEIIAHVGPLHPPPPMANDPIFTTPRLPMFLRSNKNPSTTRSVSDTKSDINIGRLHMPIRRRQSSDSLSHMRLSAMPSSPCCPGIEITSPRPRSNATGCAITESNMHALGRANTAREMMTTIKRRTSPPPPGLADNHIRSKRHSAPAEMQLRNRSGFEHPNLSLPGSF